MPSDVAFDLFMATVIPSDMSDWEWRLFKQLRLRAERSEK